MAFSGPLIPDANHVSVIHYFLVVRITGKIEMARIDDSQKVFTTLNNDLKIFVDVLKNGLKEIQSSSSEDGLHKS